MSGRPDGAFSACTPMIFTFGLIARATVIAPHAPLPAPIATIMVSTSGRSSKNLKGIGPNPVEERWFVGGVDITESTFGLQLFA